jgi:hypothetical protein
MSASNGVIRVGRKGLKKFAFGEDGEPFEIDVVVAFQAWVNVDNEFRERSEDRTIHTKDMPDYHAAAVHFVTMLATDYSAGSPNSSKQPQITTAEALDFIARLREQYDELADFFRPKSREKPDSPDSSEAQLRFSMEES